MCVRERERVCVCVCVCVCVFRIVYMDKILCFTNTFFILSCTCMHNLYMHMHACMC